MKDKGVIAFTAVASLGVLALMAAPALPGSQAAKDAAKRAAAPAPASVESKLGPEEGALTMKQRAARANHFNLQAKCASHLSDSLKDRGLPTACALLTAPMVHAVIARLWST